MGAPVGQGNWMGPIAGPGGNMNGQLPTQTGNTYNWNTWAGVTPAGSMSNTNQRAINFNPNLRQPGLVQYPTTAQVGPSGYHSNLTPSTRIPNAPMPGTQRPQLPYGGPIVLPGQANAQGQHTSEYAFPGDQVHNGFVGLNPNAPQGIPQNMLGLNPGGNVGGQLPSAPVQGAPVAQAGTQNPSTQVPVNATPAILNNFGNIPNQQSNATPAPVAQSNFLPGAGQMINGVWVPNFGSNFNMQAEAGPSFG
jgi:hypothetical protein